MDLAHDRHAHTLAGGSERGALTGETSADDQDVMLGHRSSSGGAD
jgi:hypothetical protein